MLKVAFKYYESREVVWVCLSVDLRLACIKLPHSAATDGDASLLLSLSQDEDVPREGFLIISTILSSQNAVF